MSRLPSFRGEISPWVFAVAAPALILTQHIAVALAFHLAGSPLQFDVEFWLLPLRRLAELPGISPLAAAIGFASSLALAWALALLSFQRAARSGIGFVLAALSVVPAVQIGAIALLAILPVLQTEPDPESEVRDGMNVAHVLQGVAAGMAIIVAAVLVSALTFGTYGWGLFVMTPFLVGVTTAYLANRSVALEPGRTFPLVMAAAALGSLMLVMLALEGFLCILMAAPLGALAAALGGAIGRTIALARHRHDKPLLSVALLPALFALEGAMPPAVPISIEQSIDIVAPPAAVWRALTSDAPIASDPGLVRLAGLAYPIRGHLRGEGIGIERIGIFSTGAAHERVTVWEPDRRLEFEVLSQPAAMEEMSPYRRVHAPHVRGYFETSGTQFAMQPLPAGGTRLTLRATHTLRIDPALYWEPVARWAIGQNVSRVLEDLRQRAERAAG